MKEFKFKSVYTTKCENNIEKAYDDLVSNNKKFDDVFYKSVKKEISNSSKNIFQKAKNLFHLRIEIYKKLIIKEENLKFEKSIGETVKLKNQKDNFSEIPEQKEFIEYIENKSKTIDYNLFKDYLSFSVPTALPKKLFETKNKKENNELVKLIRVRWSNLKDEIDKMSEDEKETEKTDKILEIVKEIFIFNRENQEQQGLGFKILTPNQMLSRLPIKVKLLKLIKLTDKVNRKNPNKNMALANLSIYYTSKI